MLDITVSSTELSGKITPPPFKSEVIRLLILGALCGIHPENIITPSPDLGDDIIISAKAVKSAFFDDIQTPVFVGESATLLRILAPVLAIKRGEIAFTCGKSLLRRDMSPFSRVEGCSVESAEDRLIFRSDIETGASVAIDAAGSSQFASGFLIAAAFRSDIRVMPLSPVSLPYIALTLDTLWRFGVEMYLDDDGYYRSNGAGLTPPKSFEFEADMSYAAVFKAANFVQNFDGVMIAGERSDSLQPDAAFRMLASMRDPSVQNAPDLFPLLCVCALAKAHNTHINGTGRLRDKESDRVLSCEKLIRALGGKIDVYDDSVIVHGADKKLLGGVVDACGDHRIVMAAAIASMMCEKPVRILGADSVKKSAPRFFDDFISLGGKIL